MDDATNLQQPATQDWLIALPDGVLWLAGEGPADLLWATDAFDPETGTDSWPGPA